ncbi:hypothetical protein [Actinomadura sp. HBU206391]|uniref:hypothetical protein n=1 Tax=Actinomadura sp. HBU206391 TaxID=2731692 RepID=UPI001C9BE0DA|nr:hypothetical protein [Actinomadura sp. HBU206391]
MSAPRPRPGDPGWAGPEWDDPALTALAHRLREAHRLVAPLPVDDRRRLIRQLLMITDLAKRDPELAGRRLAAFLTDFEQWREPSAEPGDQERRELRRTIGGDPGGPGESGRQAE